MKALNANGHSLNANTNYSEYRSKKIISIDNEICLGEFLIAHWHPIALEVRFYFILFNLNGTSVSKVRIILKTTAPPIPQKIIFFLCSNGNLVFDC